MRAKHWLTNEGHRHHLGLKGSIKSCPVRLETVTHQPPTPLFTLLPPTDTHSIHLVHDENKDKDFELEMTWVSEASGWKHAAVPADLLAEAEVKAKAALEEGMEED